MEEEKEEGTCTMYTCICEQERSLNYCRDYSGGGRERRWGRRRAPMFSASQCLV